LLGRVVQLHEQLPGAHFAAGREQDLRDAPFHFGRHLDLPVGLQRADAAEKARHLRRLRGGHRHLGRRHAAALRMRRLQPGKEPVAGAPHHHHRKAGTQPGP
jgi:hypothetical protein